jgi:subtilase family serine protease
VPDGKNDCKDGKNDVTVVLKNAGTARAAGIAVQLTLDGTGVGEQTVSGLAAGQEREVRFEDVRLKKGEHALQVVVDPDHAVTEDDESNNSKAVEVDCSGS